MKQHLHVYCNYEQNDWVKWLLIMKFANNNVDSATTLMFSFFYNKKFHLRMSFIRNENNYITASQQLQSQIAELITNHMKRMLVYDKERVKATQKTIIKRANHYHNNVSYEIKNMIWLNAENIKTKRLSKKLNDKNLELYKIIAKIDDDHSYKFDLLKKMCIFDTFSTKLLDKTLINCLLRQVKFDQTSCQNRV